MNRPIVPRQGADTPPDIPHLTQGEGAQSALAALIRKRQMHENHVEPESDPLPIDPPVAP